MPWTACSRPERGRQDVRPGRTGGAVLPREAAKECRHRLVDAPRTRLVLTHTGYRPIIRLLWAWSAWGEGCVRMVRTFEVMQRPGLVRMASTDGYIRSGRG